MGELYICCLVAEPGDGNFGTIDIKKKMGCDSEIFAGLYCNAPPYDPCLVEGAPCGDLLAGTCMPVYIPVHGAVSYDSIDSFDIRQPFKKNTDGTIEVSVSIDAIGCTEVFPGTGSEPAVAGDYIKADVEFSIQAGQGAPCPTLLPVATPTLSNMTAVDSTNWTSQDDALTGLGCSFSFSTTFSDAGWVGQTSLAVMNLRVRLRGFHADNSPASFCMKPTGTYAVDITSTISGTCCTPSTIHISEVDP